MQTAAGQNRTVTITSAEPGPACNVKPRYNVTGMFYFVKSGLILIIVKMYSVFEEWTIVCTSLTQVLVDLPNLDLSVLLYLVHYYGY